jgi:PAS domain S-box-containing protein
LDNGRFTGHDGGGESLSKRGRHLSMRRPSRFQNGSHTQIPVGQNSHERLAAIYEHAGVGIAEIDAEGNLLRVNPHLCGLMGHPAEELLGTSIFQATHAGDVDRDREQFRRQVAGEIDRYSVEKRLRRKDGGYFWAIVTSSAVRDTAGNFLYAVRVQHDITERKRARKELTRRAEQQSALFNFTERLQHARSLEEIYELALDAIVEALRCQRASVLLFDAANRMRFVSWRGLSEEYRRAVDGHSPWIPDSTDAQPICIDDVDRSELPDSLAQAVRAEGIGATAFIPLQGNKGLLGKFMAYFDAPHVFTDSEIAVALTIARQLGFGIERMRAEAARQRAEQALRESEARKSAILESALDGIVTVDELGRIVDFNPAAEQLSQYRRAEVLGRTVSEILIPARFREAHQSGLKASAEAGKTSAIGQRVEVQILRRDGSVFDAELAISASRLESGQVLFTYYLRDISERKRNERSAQHLAAIVASSDDAIASKDLDGVITTWNQGAERLFGYSAGEAIGKHVTILIPPERHDEEPDILARIRRGERIDHYETVRRRKDGSLVDISLTVSPIKDATGKIVGASKIARDISDRKKAEAGLRASERRLQELLAAIPAAIYTTDAQGRITYFNQAAVEMAGRTPVIGSDEWCVTWKLYLPDGTPLPHDQCPMAVALREGRPIRNVEAVAERPDGSRVPFIPYPTPLRDESGNIVGAINMLVDISERKQAETQQRILLNELNHRVKNNMQMLQSLLFSGARRTQNPEAKKILTDASHRIAAMAAAQRVFYGTSDTTRCSAQRVLDAVCETARQAFPPGVEIESEAGAAVISNDAAMPLSLILNELLTNAVKHGLSGRGQEVIRVRLTEHKGSFVLTVEDDGPGFDPEKVRKESSGLRLVEGLARQLKGHFEVTRNPSRCILRFG